METGRLNGNRVKINRKWRQRGLMENGVKINRGMETERLYGKPGKD